MYEFLSNLNVEVDAGGMFDGPEDRPDAHHELVLQSGERISSAVKPML
jgi:hypothetical protein